MHGFPLDTDLFILATSVANVLGSLPRLRSLPTSRVPVRYELQEVLPGKLTEAQAKHFASYDEELAAMNYQPVCTYRIVNYGNNLLRNYVNPIDTARCVVMINKTPVAAGGEPPATSCTVCFHTRFSDGTILTTRNMALKSIMDQPPYQITQERPGLTDLAQMKREHDRKAASMGQPVSPPAVTKSVFDDLQSEHQRFSDFYLKKGDFSLEIGSDSYTIKNKVHSRAIWNHLNPFAQNLPMQRFLPAALIAIALPLFALTKLGPAAAHSVHIGLPPFATGRLVVLGCFLLGGAVFGALIPNNTFLWTLALTYLAYRIPWVLPFGAPPFGTFAATAAHAVALAKKRRQAFLLSSTDPSSEPEPLSNAASAGYSQ
jgi:hypothetical protein